MIKYCNKIINDLHIGVKNNKITNKNIKNKSKSTNQKKKNSINKIYLLNLFRLIKYNIIISFASTQYSINFIREKRKNITILIKIEQDHIKITVHRDCNKSEENTSQSSPRFSSAEAKVTKI